MHTKLGDMESRFADLIWMHAPIPSGELAKLCDEHFGWKRTTAYTMLKRLTERGIFCNDGGTVKVLISREQFYASQCADIVEQGFGGSLPRFVAAFARGGRLSPAELAELRALIDSYVDKEVPHD